MYAIRMLYVCYMGFKNDDHSKLVVVCIASTMSVIFYEQLKQL